MSIAMVPVFLVPSAATADVVPPPPKPFPGWMAAATADSVPPPPKPFPGWIASSQREGGRAQQNAESQPRQPMRQVAEAFKKTRTCRFYPRCNKGDACRFAHAPDELRIRPNLTKTRMCAGFYDGRCKLSPDECSFAHGKQELRSREVPYFGAWAGRKGDAEGAGAASSGDRTPTTAASLSACGESRRLTATAIRLAALTGVDSDGSSSFGDSTPTLAAENDRDEAEDAFGMLGGADAVESETLDTGAPEQPGAPASKHTPEVEAIISGWTAKIRALSGLAAGVADSDVGSGATHDECIAALMKAMPAYYED